MAVFPGFLGVAVEKPRKLQCFAPVFGALARGPGEGPAQTLLWSCARQQQTLLWCFARLLSGNHDGRAVGVVGADKVHLMALHPLKAHPDIGLDVLHDVADVEIAVGVRQRGGDEKLAHRHGEETLIRPGWRARGAILVGHFRNHLNLHAGTHGDLRHAKRAAGVGSAFTKDLADQRTGAVGDDVLLGEVGGGVDQ